jgi:tRNA pseudouridine38-40 synthase
MARIAMKVAYDGVAFHGQTRQPGLATVEGEILRALGRAGVVRDPRASRFQSASRTDRGVSALGNVVAFDTALSAAATLRAFNWKARGEWAWAGAEVPVDFSARRARERWYRYILPSRHDPERLTSALALFTGTHDFRCFTRDRTRTVLRIDMAQSSREDATVVLDFRAPSFRWNLVRRLVAAALIIEEDPRERPEVERALDGSAQRDFGLAPPEPLILMDVLYDVEFIPISDPTTRDRIARLLAERTRSARFVGAVAQKFGGSFDGPPNV